MKKNVAVILSGCGFLDGAEIRESVLSLLSLAQQGAQVEIFAPDLEHAEVNHLTGEATANKRNVLAEAARIARGKIKNLKELHVKNFDVLALPGGYGVAKNLSSFATEGVNAKVHPEFERVVLEFVEAGKPIAAICIAPAVLSKILQSKGGAMLTTGMDSATAEAVVALGSKNTPTQPNEIVEDSKLKIVSTPAYMHSEAAIDQVAIGIERCILRALELSKA